MDLERFETFPIKDKVDFKKALDFLDAVEKEYGKNDKAVPNDLAKKFQIMVQLTTLFQMATMKKLFTILCKILTATCSAWVFSDLMKTPPIHVNQLAAIVLGAILGWILIN